LCAYRKKEEEKESVPQAAHAEKHRGEGDLLHYIVGCYCKEIGKFPYHSYPSKVHQKLSAKGVLASQSYAQKPEEFFFFYLCKK